MSDTTDRAEISDAKQPKRQDDRQQRILDVTLRLLEERALGEITMTMIADEAGISRAWLYKLFPDLGSLYAELFSRIQPVFFHTVDSPPPLGSGLLKYMIDRCDTYLDLPVGSAILASYALNGGEHTSSSLIGLRDRFLETLERVWVEPIVSLGNEPDFARASVLTFMNVVLGLVVAVGQARISRESAHTCLVTSITGIVGDLHGLD